MGDFFKPCPSRAKAGFKKDWGDSVIHFDGWKGYNGTVDFGYKKHFRVHHGKNEFARGFIRRPYILYILRL
jgi:hypothetical protein